MKRDGELRRQACLGAIAAPAQAKTRATASRVRRDVIELFDSPRNTLF